ncbi:MAG: hypothetical protein WD096_03850 [Actinomycetota bacterium]
MTTEPVRRARWPKRRIQVLAWFSGAATVLAGGAALATDPPVAPSRPARSERQRAAEVHVIRRIIVVDPPSAPPQPQTVTVIAPPAVQPAPAPATTGGS